MIYKRVLHRHKEDVANMLIELDKQLAAEEDIDTIEHIQVLKEQLKMTLAILEDTTSVAFQVDVNNTNKLQEQLGW